MPEDFYGNKELKYNRGLIQKDPSLWKDFLKLKGELKVNSLRKGNGNWIDSSVEIVNSCNNTNPSSMQVTSDERSKEKKTYC